jgi:hypothetical protein
MGVTTFKRMRIRVTLPDVSFCLYQTGQEAIQSENRGRIRRGVGHAVGVKMTVLFEYMFIIPAPKRVSSGNPKSNGHHKYGGIFLPEDDPNT